MHCFQSVTNLSRADSRSSFTSNLPSSIKNRSNAKRLEALVHLKLAKLEAKQAVERVEEFPRRAKQEAKRKIYNGWLLPKWKLDKVSTCILDRRYDS